MPSSFRYRLFPALLLFLAACTEDPIGVADVTGQYTATTLNVVEGPDTTNMLTGGATLTITLNANGTTSGQFFVPAALNNGTEVNASMDGTFAVTNNVVRFDQAADTFVRDMPFTPAGKTLSGNVDFGGTRVIAVLTRP